MPRWNACCRSERAAGRQRPVAHDSSCNALPVLTLVLAGMDAFNPCAFFVLLFLLSILVHTRSCRFMLLVGGVFVTISGLVYFTLH